MIDTAIENGPFMEFMWIYSWFSMILMLNMMIFQSYVRLPECNVGKTWQNGVKNKAEW